jgi:hypothetical protein
LETPTALCIPCAIFLAGFQDSHLKLQYVNNGGSGAEKHLFTWLIEVALAFFGTMHAQ